MTEAVSKQQASPHRAATAPGALLWGLHRCLRQAHQQGHRPLAVGARAHTRAFTPGDLSSCRCIPLGRAWPHFPVPHAAFVALLRSPQGVSSPGSVPVTHRTCSSSASPRLSAGLSQPRTRLCCPRDMSHGSASSNLLRSCCTTSGSANGIPQLSRTLLLILSTDTLCYRPRGG